MSMKKSLVVFPWIIGASFPAKIDSAERLGAAHNAKIVPNPLSTLSAVVSVNNVRIANKNGIRHIAAPVHAVTNKK